MGILIYLCCTIDVQSSTQAVTNEEIVISDHLSLKNYAEFAQLANAGRIKTVIFRDCLGGNVLAGIQYAKIIRSYRISTVASGLVSSACAFAYLGGVNRKMDENAAWTTIMFHGGFDIKTLQSVGKVSNQIILDQIEQRLNFNFSSRVNQIILDTKKVEEGIYFFKNKNNITLVLYCDGDQAEDYTKCKKLEGITLESEKVIN